MRTQTTLIGAGITRHLTRKTGITVGGSAQRTQLGNDDVVDLEGWNGEAALSHNFSKGLSMNLGYNRGLATFGAGTARVDAVTDAVDIGLSRNAPRLSRHSVLSFSTGVTGVRIGNDRRYSVIGSAVLGRELGRSW